MNIIFHYYCKVLMLPSLDQQVINRVYSFLFADDLVRSAAVSSGLKQKTVQTKFANILWDPKRPTTIDNFDTVILPFVCDERTTIVRFPKSAYLYDISLILSILTVLIHNGKRSNFSLYLIFDVDANVNARMPFDTIDFKDFYNGFVQKGGSIKVFVESMSCDVDSLSILQGYNTSHYVVHVESLRIIPMIGELMNETCDRIRESRKKWLNIRKFIYSDIFAIVGLLCSDNWSDFGGYINELSAESEFLMDFNINLSDYRNIESLRNGIETFERAKEKKIKVFLTSVSLNPILVKKAGPIERILMADIISLIYKVCTKKTKIIIDGKVTYSVSDKIIPDDIVRISVEELPIQDTEDTIFL